jgi:hypothetical protein
MNQPAVYRPDVIEPIQNPFVMFTRTGGYSPVYSRYHWSYRSGNGHVIARSRKGGYKDRDLMIQRCCEVLDAVGLISAPQLPSGKGLMRASGEVLEVKDEVK